MEEFSKDASGRTKQIVVAESNKYDVHKSIKHFDGDFCFGGGWFIVSAKLAEVFLWLLETMMRPPKVP